MIRNLTCVAAAAVMFCAFLPEHAKAQVIDCDDPATSSTALQDAIDTGQYLIEFTGTCEEDLGIYWDDIHLRGTNADPRQNVIDGEVNVGVTEDIVFENLKVTGNYFNVTNEAYVFMRDMVIEDTQNGVFIARNSGATMDNVTIGAALVDDGTLSCTPLCVGENSYVRMTNSTVNGATNDTAAGGAVTVYRDASLLLRGGNTITNSGSTAAIGVFADSSFRQDNSQGNGTDTISAGTGPAVSVFRTSTFDTREAVITGDIEVGQHSFMNVGSSVFGGDPSLMIIDGDIELSQDSALTTSSPLVNINGTISCDDDESSAAVDFAGTGTNTCSGFDAEVVRDDGTAQFVVDENSPVVANRFLFELENNGPPRMRFTNSDTGNEWWYGPEGLAGLGADRFVITRPGSGGGEFNIFRNGRIIMGRPGGGNKFDLSTSGNLTIAGTLTENSDVNAKQDIAPVDGEAILDQVASLPVSTWTYKADETGARHVGPMAQDFHAAFGFGENDTSLAPRDVAGVALAAVKQLQEELRQKEAEILALQARNASLEENDRRFQERLEALERQLAR